MRVGKKKKTKRKTKKKKKKKKKKKTKKGGGGGGAREWTSMLKFHTLLNLWLKICNSNTNLPQAEQEFDKVNFEKMNPLPTLSRTLSGLASSTFESPC